uniref:Reverse transcriptase domain-containing protein n=1 Tax=Tanacetum cinerariifolium TaxID=118510 RepID=A0A6L2JNH8_TANCI|nr:hypothetical protein [Tanacetum cinerariifolium]
MPSSIPSIFSDCHVLHLYLADKPKDNTLTGSVPSQDKASRGKMRRGFQLERLAQLLRLRFVKIPWKYLRLKMSEEDDNLKVKIAEPKQKVVKSKKTTMIFPRHREMEKSGGDSNKSRTLNASFIRNVDGKIMGKDGLHTEDFPSLVSVPVDKVPNAATKEPCIQATTEKEGHHAAVESDIFWNTSCKDGNSKSSTSESVSKEHDIIKPTNSFAGVLMDKLFKKVVKIKEMRSEVNVAGAAVTIPFEAVEAVNAGFINTLVGYFIGDSEKCPNLPKENTKPKANEEGFTEVKSKKTKKQSTRKQVEGIRLSKPNLNLQYRRVDPKSKKSDGNKDGKKHVSEVNLSLEGAASTSTNNVIKLKNSYSSLEDDETDWDNTGTKLSVIDESDSEDVDEVMVLEEPNGHKNDLRWNHNDVDISVINQDDQSMHIRVWVKADRKEFFCSIVYAHNRYTQRRLLWNNLWFHKLYVRDRPWCILGDFNAALFLHDYSVGISNIDISMREFKECVEDLEILDVQYSGLQFTWTQKPKGNEGLLKKIDRVMANLKFNDVFVGSHAIFKPYRNSDHAPSVLCIPSVIKPKPKPFKFYNLITSNDNFKRVVLEGWTKYVSGFHMFRVQVRLDADPFNESIREEEAMILVAFNEACLMEEKFLKQKAKIDWLREGDSNSAYFHKSVKSRISRSRIDVISSENGEIFENEHVADAFVNHYKMSLGQPGNTSDFCDIDLFRVRLDESLALDMTRQVTLQEVKSALFSMGNDKSPGPGGYTAAFFKESWDIVADDFVAAVREFFANGKLLRELNHTIIALIPKESLKVLISPNQSAFVSGRSIADNILLTQELMHNYHLDRGVARCAFKVDIQKAYDTVDWVFLKNILAGFGFHDRMIGWIMECVTTTSFSISINGSLHGFFKGKRSLRQRDPLSPYLFTLVMEILTLMLQRGVDSGNLFVYHRYCSKMKLINLCFADDLFLFSHGDTDSVKVIKGALNEFQEASGLKGRSKVAWEAVCLPKDEGGLGVRRLDTFNKALMVSHIWKLLSLKESLWVKWVHIYKLKGRNRGPSRCAFKVDIQKAYDTVDWNFLRSILVGFGFHHVMCGNILSYGTYLNCNSRTRNSFTYDPIPESLDEVQISPNPPPQCHFSVNPLIDHHYCYEYGNSLNDFFCYQCACEFCGNDAHSTLGPLADFVSSRDRCLAGLNASLNVREVLHDGIWSWPLELCSKYPQLQNIQCKSSNLNGDRLEWRDEGGMVKPFSVSMVWSTIRHRNPKVDWYDAVWFPYCIPRHAFNLWLVINQKLKTQDKVTSWEVSDSLMTVCSLCEMVQDSHDHIFFECPFSKQVWLYMKSFAALPNSNEVFQQILLEVISFSKRKSPKEARKKQIEEEQAAKAQNSKIPFCCDDDDDYNSAITPNEPVDSLSMGDEHLDTIPATESEEFIKSSVENLVPNPSESEGESGCDVTACFTTFSNVLFDAEYDFYSVNDQSFFDEDFPKEIYSNPLFDEEIIPMKKDPHSFNDEFDLIESMLNHDSSIIISSKIESFFDEFAGEVTLHKSIPPGIDETNCYPEEKNHFTKRLLYDNSSPRPLEEFVYDNSDADIESFSPSPIPVEDSYGGN